MVKGASTTALIIGKALCYTVIYMPMAMYVMVLIPHLFNLPHIGNPVEALLFIFPLLLASTFFGQTLTYFAKERESTFMVVVFTSVVFLFLSGLTWPRYAMNDFWRFCGDLIPGVWGAGRFHTHQQQRRHPGRVGQTLPGHVDSYRGLLPVGLVGDGIYQA